MAYTNERMKRATLRAVKAESIEGFPQADCGNGWWVEAHGMRASDVADCGLTSENVALLFASAPKMLADLAVAREMLDAKDAEIGKLVKQIQNSEEPNLHRIIAKQQRLLNEVAFALRGPPPLMVWSHHDLPERAAEAVKTLAERDALCESQTRTINGLAEMKGAHERLRHVLVGTLTNAGEFLPAGRNPDGTNEDPCAPGVIRSSIEHLAADRDRYRAEAERLEGLVGEARLIAERDDAERKLCEMREALEHYANREYHSRTNSDGNIQYRADCALADTADIASRWMTTTEHAEILARVKAEGDALAQAVDKAIGVSSPTHELRMKNLADPKGALERRERHDARRTKDQPMTDKKIDKDRFVAEMAWRDCDDPKEKPCLACAACVDNILKSEAIKDTEIVKLTKQVEESHADTMEKIDIAIAATKERDAALATLAERDALCESQTRTLTAQAAKADAAEKERDDLDARLGHVLILKDAAERKVCEMRAPTIRAYEHLSLLSDTTARDISIALDDALSDTTDIASRWVPVAVLVNLLTDDERETAADVVAAGINDMAGAAKHLLAVRRIELIQARSERDAAIAAKEAAASRAKVAEDLNAENARDAEEVTRDVIARMEADRLRCDAAESREHALGVQVEALRQRVRLADGLADAVGDLRESWVQGDDLSRAMTALRKSHAKYHAVPGDALAVPVVDYREASGVDVERVSVAVDEKGGE